MVRWHHRLSGHDFEQAPGVRDGQRSLVCWGHKESDMTESLSNNNSCTSFCLSCMCLLKAFTLAVQFSHSVVSDSLRPHESQQARPPYSNQCKEIEENNRMVKNRDLFRKIRDTKGTFHAKMGSIKDRNGMNLTEAEDIKKRWQEYTEELYKKDLHDPDNYNGVITLLESDILECEVKWALGSITTNKASRGNGIPVELLQILKDDAVKVLHSICQHIWKTQQWPQDWKRSVFIPS